MDIWTAIQTILEKNPGIKAKFLIQELRERTGLSRSTIYEHLTSLKLRGKIYTEKGYYFLANSTKENLKHELGLIQRLILIRERYSEVPMLVLAVGMMLFFLFALSPTVFETVSSVNMTAWNFTGHEALRVIFPVTPYIIIMAMIITVICLGLDIIKIFSRKTTGLD